MNPYWVATIASLGILMVGATAISHTAVYVVGGLVLLVWGLGVFR